jgi:hypothetical protein
MSLIEVLGSIYIAPMPWLLSSFLMQAHASLFRLIDRYFFYFSDLSMQQE